MAYSDLLQPFNIFGGSPQAPAATATKTPATAPAVPPGRTPLPGEQVYDLTGGKATLQNPVPNAPKTPTRAPAIVPSYSFLDGSKYAPSGKQVSPPTVVTAKAATQDLGNKKAALDQVVQAQSQQQQSIQQNNSQAQAQTQPATAPATTAAPASPSDTATDTTGAATQTNSAIQAVQAQADSAYNNFTSSLARIQNGTFPLTPSQMAQVNATQQSFDELKQQQQMVNDNFAGQVALTGVQTGINQTAPQINLSQIHDALTSGIAQIGNIDAQASKAVADLQQGFMTQDYSMINDAYTAASKLFADKTTALNDMNTNVRNAANDALAAHKEAVAESQQQLDNQKAAIQFAATNGITSPYYLVGNTAIDTKTGLPVTLAQYQAATGQQVGASTDQTDFSQIQHIADPQTAALMTKYPDAGILRTDTPQDAQSKLKDSAIYHKETYIAPPAGSGGGVTGVTQATDANGNPIQIPNSVAPYYNQSHNGVGWVDASTLQGTAAEKRNIVNDAQSSGLKVITNKNQAADLTNINDAYAKLDTIGSIMAGIDQPGWIQRDLGGLGFSKLQAMAQSDPQKAAAGALSSVGLDILKAISGVQGFRGNTAAIQQVKDHLPSIYDTNATAQQKISFTQQLIADRENAITGKPKTAADTSTPQEGQTGTLNGVNYKFTGGQWVSQ